ncbi:MULTISPECIES: ATP-dependent nuclease [Pseudomonas]|uniref:ATP-dependent nuclease n=1 Tax=Pseudomonas nitroreducens TaxID=46680 RepID=UPI001E35D4EF|nr:MULTISPECIES: AAA family ATPase [Pseudomonas]MCE4071524.1 AAA family ATPase [Pseudomonas nitritireducens]MCE4081300.1 AAA family ATPase [Pseudomonas nitroreducens]
MSKILDFEIENYKGIVKTRIELAGRIDSPVVTLIGLNESGKTTILEAISQFVSRDRSVSSLYFFSPENREEFTFIPVSRKGAFTGVVSIAATVVLDAEEVKEICALGQKIGLDVDAQALSKPFKIVKAIRFENSVARSSSGSLAFDLKVKLPSCSDYEVYAQPDEESENLWIMAAALIADNIPAVAYFPTFLIHVPEEISLAQNELQNYEARHYREIIERIISFSGFNVVAHINDRLERFRDRNGQNWIEKFYRSEEWSQVDAVFKTVSQKLTSEVIGGWRRVLSRDTTAKRIELKWTVVDGIKPSVKVSFRVSSGDSDYKVSERSTGFRWFFTFLLLTGFKLEKDERQKIYVFDEPAANLHSRAQVELLRYFERMTSSGDKIIYSTHSHHMIDPRWLSGAYIIENRAVGRVEADEYDLEFLPAEINAIKYKNFVSSYPGRYHYFQPVIDRLQYIVPEIVGAKPSVIVEGITDYYALKAASLNNGSGLSFNIIPGVGSSAAGHLISLLLGRGEEFIVLLDDDKEGRKGRDRYRKEWVLSDQVVITWANIDPRFDGMALEQILGRESLQVTQHSLNLTSLPDKSQYALILAEHYYKGSPAGMIFSSEGLENLQKVIGYLERRFKKFPSSPVPTVTAGDVPAAGDIE